MDHEFNLSPIQSKSFFQIPEISISPFSLFSPSLEKEPFASGKDASSAALVPVTVQNEKANSETPTFAEVAANIAAPGCNSSKLKANPTASKRKYKRNTSTSSLSTAINRFLADWPTKKECSNAGSTGLPPLSPRSKKAKTTSPTTTNAHFTDAGNSTSNTMH